MSDAKNASKPAIAARDFKDEGTGKLFTGGAPIDASDGAIANYRAAGLVADDEPADEALTIDPPVDDKAGDGKPTKPKA